MKIKKQQFLAWFQPTALASAKNYSNERKHTHTYCEQTNERSLWVNLYLREIQIFRLEQIPNIPFGTCAMNRWSGHIHGDAKCCVYHMKIHFFLAGDYWIKYLYHFCHLYQWRSFRTNLTNFMEKKFQSFFDNGSQSQSKDAIQRDAN